MTVETEDVKTENASSGPGKDPTESKPKKLTMAFHPELLGLRPQGRFPEGWQARRPVQPQSAGHAGYTGRGSTYDTAATKRRIRGNADTDRDGEGRRYEHRQAGAREYAGHKQDTACKQHEERRTKDDGIRKRHVWDPEEGYSSTCCGKCEYFQRVWRTSVWACNNSESKNHRFPVDYGNTCEQFKRLSR